MSNHHRYAAFPEPEVRRSGTPRGLYWLIGLSLLLALLSAVLLASGFRVLLYARTTTAGAEPHWQAALNREAALRQELALLQEQWLGRQAQCPVAARPPNPKPAPVAPPIPLPSPLAENPLVEGPSASAPDTPLVIPGQPENLEFLDGCWRSVTDLFDTRDKKPIQHEYCFNDHGAGEVTVKSNRFTCKGKISAVMQGRKKLVIKTLDSALACNNESRFSGWQVICQSQKDGQAVCQGTNYNDKTRFSVTLLRK